MFDGYSETPYNQLIFSQTYYLVQRNVTSSRMER